MIIDLQVISDQNPRSKRVNDSFKTAQTEAVPNDDTEGAEDPKVSVLRPATEEGREMAWTDVKSGRRQA